METNKELQTKLSTLLTGNRCRRSSLCLESITGVKVEDTGLVREAGHEALTLTPSLPATRIDGIPCALALEVL